MITKDGRVKVLDFGLATLREEAVPSDATAAPTRPLTGQERIVGTVAYMSPEQASAGAVDQRSDLFSLGVMLYELVTGIRPFSGDNGVATLASILRDTPKVITDLRPEIPRDLARIIRRALAKDPERRYQTAKDLRNDLQTLHDDLASGELVVASPVSSRVHLRYGLAQLATLVAVGVIVTGTTVYLATSRPTAPANESGAISRLTATGKASLAAISPDGKYVVHVVNDG
jgi:serine/threonine protein kinase